MTDHRFTSKIAIRGSFDDRIFTADHIKNEPMLFNASLPFAARHGGPITAALIAALPDDWRSCDPVIDSRVHMLMLGWYPCISGFHHDDVPRGRSDGQPDYETPAYWSEHLTALVGGAICPTVFALGAHTLPAVPVGDLVYRTWHPIVEQQIAEGVLARFECPSGTLVEFDWQTMHAGQRARAGGWRWFMRLSRHTERQARRTNEIRRQTQVYLEFPMEGW